MNPWTLTREPDQAKSDNILFGKLSWHFQGVICISIRENIVKSVHTLQVFVKKSLSCDILGVLTAVNIKMYDLEPVFRTRTKIWGRHIFKTIRPISLHVYKNHSSGHRSSMQDTSLKGVVKNRYHSPF